MPVNLALIIAMFVLQILIVQHAQAHFIIISINAFNLVQLEHVLIYLYTLNYI